jgi:DNA polymerase III epsilon subunit-like protein
MIPMSGVALHRYPTVCPVLSTFLNSPIQGKTPQWVEKLSSDNEGGENPIETEQQTRTPISEFIMTEDNRRLNDIPESLGGLAPPGFVTTIGKKSRIIFETIDNDELSAMLTNQRDAAAIAGDADLSNLIGIDCEMVKTIIGRELARVSLIDHMGRVLYDSVVRPENEVTDYLTQYSGITAKMIRECKTSFREAQERTLSYLDGNVILVGHAIQNDLKCLKLIHERIIDTSDIYPHPNGHPSKHSLVFLLSRVLGESLSREGGHDSVEDAKATVRIAMKKFARGWEYNPAGSSTLRWAPLGTLFDGPRALYLDPETLDEPARYKTDGFEINPEKLPDAKLRIHVVRDFQAACENNTPRRDALLAMDAKIRKIISTMGDNHLVLAFSGCGDVHTFKRFEKLAGICEDETQRVDLEKALQRSKDRAVSAFAMISAVGDLPLSVRSCNKQLK